MSVNLVDLVKSFQTSVYLQYLASIQKRTSPVKFDHLAEKSGEGSISNLSTKVRPGPPPEAAEPRRRGREQPHARREQSGVGALRALLAARRRDRRPRLSQNNHFDYQFLRPLTPTYMIAVTR